MTEAQRLWSRSIEGDVPYSAAGKHDARDWQEREEGRNANEVVADAVGELATGRELAASELRYAAPAVHYLFGATVAAMYGAAIGTRSHSALAGATFGTVVWIVADELAMPALGLSKTPASRRVNNHLQSLAAHLVFGMVTERARASLVRASW